MKLLRSARWLLLALAATLIPASSLAGVFISVGFAPPMLPVYEQPPCPQPGLMWTPGYWAYGPDGYYWVPGAWVPAPYPGALWTPGYWGWANGLYVFHDGYWGRHVGYYGGVNYGFGYGGIGFSGGMWHGGVFAYNTAVTHVDGRFVRSTYMDRGTVDRGIVARSSHVAFSGGPGGIHYQPNAQERMAGNEPHQGRTSFQAQREAAAGANRSSYARSNARRNGAPSGGRNYSSPGMRNQARPAQGNQPRYAQRNQARLAQGNQPRYAQRNQARPASRFSSQANSNPREEREHR